MLKAKSCKIVCNRFITLSGYTGFPSVFKCARVGSLKFCAVKSKFSVGFPCCRVEKVTGTYWLQMSDVKISPLAKEQNPAIFLSVCAVIDTIDSLINDMGKEPD